MASCGLHYPILCLSFFVFLSFSVWPACNLRAKSIKAQVVTIACKLWISIEDGDERITLVSQVGWFQSRNVVCGPIN